MPPCFLTAVAICCASLLGQRGSLPPARISSGAFDLVDEVDGRAVLPERLVLDRIAHEEAVVLLELRVFVLEFGEPVDEGNDGDSGRPHFRMAGDGHHGEVAAVAAAHDDELGWIDKAGVSDEFGGSEDIVQLLASGIVAIAFLELPAITGSAAIVRCDHEIALIVHVLDEAVEAVHGLRGGASVDVNDGRILLIADDVVGDICPGGDGEFAVMAGVVNQRRRDHAGRS